ncbi:hypothetical protein OS493_020741 [Desmophyllum pertusum]|uniref:E3 ubiquitin-protein ligase HACE1 n=1 Tax=Desmophyllum pertusum TaxID=174260 RepID=A0A9X0CJK5_9CNID|nr:hypothetical protein OS493_020741 [Desmophyllum pertusum]
MGADVFACKTDDGGNILHFALECASHFKSTWESTKDTSQCLRALLTTKLLIDQPDDHGFTPLMYACESGNAECVELLLGNGASIKCVDSHGTTSLHLAAMSGDTQCVQLLLNFGHQVDCVDRYGWPPLLYANFKAQESCVLALMKPKPEQVFVLGGLLRRARNEIEKKRTVKVVKNVLVSLANHDAYYTVFNDFIRQNPEMLEENNYGLLQHIWRAILDFDNKRRWFLRKLSQISWMRESVDLKIDRENVLGSAMNQMGKLLGHALRKKSLYVTFKNEPGVCTGPKREFFACFCKDVIDPKRGLFIATDDAQYSPVANAYFAKYVNEGTQQDSSHNTASSEVTTIKQEDSSECTDEELVSALSQAEALAATMADSNAESQLVNNLSSDALAMTTTDTVSAECQSVNNLLSEVIAATTADTTADCQTVNNLLSEVIAATIAHTSAESQSVNNLLSEALAMTTADTSADSQSANNLSSEALAATTADTSAESESVNNLSSEALAATTVDASTESQSVNNLSSEAQHVLENIIVSQSPEEQISLSESVSGQEGAALVDGETNMESSSQVESNERAEESNQTSNSAEACNGTSNSNEHDYCGSSNHEHNTAVLREQTWIPCMEQKSGDQAITNLSLRSKLKQLRFIGRMIGFAICQDLLLDLHLSKPFVKQILGIPLSLPDDLMSFDYELHKNAVVWVRENSINELESAIQCGCIESLEFETSHNRSH